MSTTITIVSVIALILTMVVPFGFYLAGERNRGRFKTSLTANIFLFFGALIIANVVAFTNTSAALAAETTSASAGGLSTGLGYIAAGLIFVAMAEGIALYGLIISFMILGQL